MNQQSQTVGVVAHPHSSKSLLVSKQFKCRVGVQVQIQSDTVDMVENTVYKLVLKLDRYS